MERDPRAYLWDVIDSADAIASRIPELVQAVALRNPIIHGDAKVNDEVIRRMVQTDVPRLHERVTALLGELGTDR